MNAEELRKGNIVLWSSDVACISQILEKEVVFSCGEMDLLEAIEPMPFSSRWKFKFNLGSGINVQNDRFSGFIRVSKRFVGPEWSFYIGEVEAGRFVSVSEFQNLFFALTYQDIQVEWKK